MSKFVEEVTKVVSKRVVAGKGRTRRFAANYELKPYGKTAVEFTTGSFDSERSQSFHKEDLAELIAELTAVHDALEDCSI